MNTLFKDDVAMTDEAQKLIESEDEIVPKKRKVSKAAPKKTPKKVSKEKTRKKVSKKNEKKKKSVPSKGDDEVTKKTRSNEQVGCVVLYGIGWCHVPCSCKPR